MDHNHNKMIMSNQTDPVKQNIMDWCNADGITFEDESSKYPNMDWSLMIRKRVAVDKQKRFSDRIYFHAGFNFAPEHKTLIQSNNQLRNEIILQIPLLLSQMDVTSKIEGTGNDITGISLSKVHFHSSIKKADFLSLYTRVHQVFQALLNQLGIKLKVTLQQLQQNQSSPPPDASDVGIG